MSWENFKDINLEDAGEHFVKIFKKSDYRNSEEDLKDINLDSDDSNMKIFSRD